MDYFNAFLKCLEEDNSTEDLTIQKFLVAATSQSKSNENFNGVVAHRMPKGRSYSLSASGDYRFAGAVLNRNEVDSHRMILEKKLSLSPGKYTAKLAQNMDETRERRNKKIKLKEIKCRRILLAKKMESLRKKNKSNEGVQYKRNYAFDVDTLNLSRPSEICQIVFFDLETSGFGKTADILQIAARCVGRSFSVYVNPTQEIHVKASEVTGMRNIGGELFVHNQKVTSIPLKDALRAFCQFLNSVTSNPCLLVAHNASFDASYLFRAVQKCYMLQNFSFIAGYVDTLYILRKKMPKRKGKGMFKLTTLARDFLHIDSSENFHEGLYDVEILEKITSAKISKQDLLTNVQCFFMPLILRTLAPLKVAASTMMIKRISKEGITYSMMEKVYLEKGKEGILKLFTEDIGDKQPRITRNKKIIHKIIDVIQDLI